MKQLAILVLVLTAAAGVVALRVRAQEPVIPYAPPRPASTLVMLPDGSTVHVELATTEAQKEYGLMERTHLAQGRGMLFVHQNVADHGYWMYHCKMALDIVWMDANHRIVEMSPNTPPCRGRAATCPTYGGHEPSKYVLELSAGSIALHHLQVGQRIDFNLGQ
jgi:uncharacterized protein